MKYCHCLVKLFHNINAFVILQCRFPLRIYAAALWRYHIEYNSVVVFVFSIGVQHARKRLPSSRHKRVYGILNWKAKNHVDRHPFDGHAIPAVEIPHLVLELHLINDVFKGVLVPFTNHSRVKVNRPLLVTFVENCRVAWIYNEIWHLFTKCIAPRFKSFYEYSWFSKWMQIFMKTHTWNIVAIIAFSSTKSMTNTCGLDNQIIQTNFLHRDIASSSQAAGTADRLCGEPFLACCALLKLHIP